MHAHIRTRRFDRGRPRKHRGRVKAAPAASAASEALTRLRASSKSVRRSGGCHAARNPPSSPERDRADTSRCQTPRALWIGPYSACPEGDEGKRLHVGRRKGAVAINRSEM